MKLRSKRRPATKRPVVPPPVGVPPPATPLTVVHPHAAAIDVHSDNHVVCVGPDRVQTFGAYTADLAAIAEHLREAQVTTVVMESTGVYWIALFDVLERHGFQVLLMEPSQGKHCGARAKTDVLDCQWHQRLHAYGLLRGSFRPAESVRRLRDYWRQRQSVLRSAAREVQHVQKALEQMNVKLTEVVSDLTGQTGRAILDAIVAGERDAQVLARLRNGHCQRSEAELALALTGFWQPEHLLALKQSWATYHHYHQQMAECDRVMEAELKAMAKKTDRDVSSVKKPRGRKPNDVTFDACNTLYQTFGVDLTAIEGISVSTALVILGEVGVDVSKFPTEKHFASWLGLCPRVDRSNRTEKRRGPPRGKNRVTQALRMCAQSISRMKTPLASFYHRIKARIGGQGAITAVAHKLARLVYQMLKYGVEYVKQSMEQYAVKVRVQKEKLLKRRARELGYDIVLRSTGEVITATVSDIAVTGGAVA